MSGGGGERRNRGFRFRRNEFYIAPILTPIAATGLALTMAGAVVVHLRRGDGIAAAVPAIVLGGLSAFLAVMRFGPEAF